MADEPDDTDQTRRRSRRTGKTRKGQAKPRPKAKPAFDSKVKSHWPTYNELNLIQDPETGLALLAKCPAAETPEQERERQFWQHQFTDWRDWLAGDVLAVGRGVQDCVLFNGLPPFWLEKASILLGVQCMSDDEKRARSDINMHWRRWKAVKLVRGQHPKDPDNFKSKVKGDDVWEEAAKLVKGTAAEGDAETVRKSYQLIQRSGGVRVTLPSYKRDMREHGRRRKRG
jgi:hypothetical protein